jgi:hypothetical protein
MTPRAEVDFLRWKQPREKAEIKIEDYSIEGKPHPILSGFLLI